MAWTLPSSHHPLLSRVVAWGQHSREHTGPQQSGQWGEQGGVKVFKRQNEKVGSQEMGGT